MADIQLTDGSTALAHDPSLGLSGLTQPGCKVIVTPTGFDSTKKTKWGTKRTQYKVQLVETLDKENESLKKK